MAGAAGYLLKGTPVEKIVEAIKDVKAGGAVIQPNLARALLRIIGKRPPRGTSNVPPGGAQAGSPTTGGLSQNSTAAPGPGDATRVPPVGAGDAAQHPLLGGAMLDGGGEDDDGGSVLTDRELEILQIIAKGLSNNEAAKVLGLSKATIRTHLEHIYEKLDVTNRVEAVTEGIRQGIINI
jgi:DNA-binding NarL/FixJ family response regulator